MTNNRSKIEWTDSTWSPTVGCTKVSPGCDHCYAERITERFHGKGSFAVVKLHHDRLDAPLRWRKPRRVFVDSMSDLFHDAVPDEFIARVWAVMAATPQHTYQILTKRHGRMRSLLNSDQFRERAFLATNLDTGELHGSRWPIPNCWLGVSVEDQKRADLRIPALIDTPAAVRFLSCEPLLGPTDLSGWFDTPLCCGCGDNHGSGCCSMCMRPEPSGIDWCIVGGESGPGARPMNPDWARSLRDQCQSAGVPFLFKQWGGATPKSGGRELDGRTWDEFPAETTQAPQVVIR